MPMRLLFRFFACLSFFFVIQMDMLYLIKRRILSWRTPPQKNFLLLYFGIILQTTNKVYAFPCLGSLVSRLVA